MNKFFISMLYNIILSSLVSFSTIVFLLIFFGALVQYFQLNQGKDAYWVFNVTFLASIVTWIVSFGYFMSRLQ